MKGSCSKPDYRTRKALPFRRSFAIRLPLLAALTLIVAAACTDQTPTGLISDVQVRRSSVEGGLGRPTLFSNAAKYRDQGLKPATGRSGSASLTARALLGKDGVTTLDITTGEIDAATAPGLLKKVQLKEFDPNGNLQRTHNYREIGAPATVFHLPAQARGSQVQVQANATGIDPNRTDVVTVTETVKLRPDLAVNGITADAQAVIGTVVNISAVVTERNGDVGARSDCVLSVDGTEVDRANGIWVDAAGTVSCLFMHTFSALGSKQLTVNLVGVNPGDYDNANNSASTTIQIVAPPSTNDFEWNAQFNGIDEYRYLSTSEGNWRRVSGESGEWSYYRNIRWRTERQTYISGFALGSVGTPLTFEFRDRLDDAVLNDIVYDPTTDTQYAYDFSYTDEIGATVRVQWGCANLQRLVPATYNGTPISAAGAYVSVCTYQYTGGSFPPGYTNTSFGASTTAGDVSYYSSDYSRFVYPGGGESVYSYNEDYTFAHGNPTFGSEYSFAFVVTGPNGSKQASGAVPITTTNVAYSQPQVCRDFIDTWYETYHECSALSYSYIWFQGYTSGAPGN